MKVVHLSNFAYQYVVSLVNSLSDRCECVLLSPASNNGEAFFQQLSHKVIHEKYNNFRVSNPANFFEARKILDTIRRHNPDILHIQHHGDLWLSLLMKFTQENFRIVNTVHDIKPHVGFERFYHRPHASVGRSISDKYIVHGESLRGELMKRYSINKDKISVISHGNYDIYVKLFNSSTEEEPNTVLFFGKLYEYKGLKYLLKAIPEICKYVADFRLIVAVHGESFSKYRKYIDDSYMKNLEIIERYIPEEDIGKLFSRAALVILPYVSASQSGVVPLSYSFGKPVVATNVGALPEIILDGQTGYIGKSKDTNYLSEKIIYLLKNPTIRKEMGNKAKIYSDKHLSWNKIGNDYSKLYEKLIRYEK